MHEKDHQKKQVALAVELSKEYGYDSLDTEYWNNQPAESIKLIMDMFDDMEPV